MPEFERKGGLAFFQLRLASGETIERSPSLQGADLPARFGTADQPAYGDLRLPRRTPRAGGRHPVCARACGRGRARHAARDPRSDDRGGARSHGARSLDRHAGRAAARRRRAGARRRRGHRAPGRRARAVPSGGDRRARGAHRCRHARYPVSHRGSARRIAADRRALERSAGPPGKLVRAGAEVHRRRRARTAHPALRVARARRGGPALAGRPRRRGGQLSRSARHRAADGVDRRRAARDRALRGGPPAGAARAVRPSHPGRGRLGRASPRSRRPGASRCRRRRRRTSRSSPIAICCGSRWRMFFPMRSTTRPTAAPSKSASGARNSAGTWR